MQAAIKLARKNLDGSNGGPFGAVVVKDDQVVGRGSNEVIKNNDPSAHAEVVAIRDACRTLNTYDLSGCIIFASCEPCPMCLGAVYWARIDKLYYAATKDDAAEAQFDDAFFYKELALDPPKRSMASSQLLREDAVKVFKEWIESGQADKIRY